jgi:hypothetical protein
MADVGRASPLTLITEDKAIDVDLESHNDSGIDMDVGLGLGPAPSGVFPASTQARPLATQSAKKKTKGDRTPKRRVVTVEIESELTSLPESPISPVSDHIESAVAAKSTQHIPPQRTVDPSSNGKRTMDSKVSPAKRKRRDLMTGEGSEADEQSDAIGGRSLVKKRLRFQKRGPLSSEEADEDYAHGERRRSDTLEKKPTTTQHRVKAKATYSRRNKGVTRPSERSTQKRPPRGGVATDREESESTDYSDIPDHEAAPTTPVVQNKRTTRAAATKSNLRSKKILKNELKMVVAANTNETPSTKRSSRRARTKARSAATASASRKPALRFTSTRNSVASPPTRAPAERDRAAVSPAVIRAPGICDDDNDGGGVGINDFPPTPPSVLSNSKVSKKSVDGSSSRALDKGHPSVSTAAIRSLEVDDDDDDRVELADFSPTPAPVVSKPSAKPTGRPADDGVSREPRARLSVASPESDKAKTSSTSKPKARSLSELFSLVAPVADGRPTSDVRGGTDDASVEEEMDVLEEENAVEQPGDLDGMDLDVVDPFAAEANDGQLDTGLGSQAHPGQQIHEERLEQGPKTKDVGVGTGGLDAGNASQWRERLVGPLGRVHDTPKDKQRRDGPVRDKVSVSSHLIHESLLYLVWPD